MFGESRDSSIILMQHMLITLDVSTQNKGIKEIKGDQITRASLNFDFKLYAFGSARSGFEKFRGGIRDRQVL